MNRILFAAAFACIAVLLAYPAYAKRAAPKEVAPVQKDGIEYSASHERQGYVIAT